MLDSYTVRTLKFAGFEDGEIMEAEKSAEINGTANLGGYTVRYNNYGEMIALHPDRCGIYVGDYNAHVIFQRDISYTCEGFGFESAKYREMPEVMEALNNSKTNGYILCECPAGDYERRVKQLKKLGYCVYRSTIEKCKDKYCTCSFLVA